MLSQARRRKIINMINFADEKRRVLSIKEKIEEAKMIADDYNLRLVMFLYAELREVKLITAHFNDMESAYAFYRSKCGYMLGQYWSYMGYVDSKWDIRHGAYVSDLEKIIM